MYYLILFTSTIFLIIFSTALYKCWIKPYRKFKHYETVLPRTYQTYVIPFSFLGYKMFNGIAKDQKQHGDCHYSYKTIYPKYQVILSNFGTDIALDLIDPQLIKEFFQNTYHDYYSKCKIVQESFREFGGNNMFLSEGHQFKIRKKIITQVFNYKFIHAQIPAIIRICQEQTQKFQHRFMLKDNKMPIIVSHLLHSIFGNVLIKCFFGRMEFEKIEGKDIFQFVDKSFGEIMQRNFSYFNIIFGSKFNKLNLRAIDRSCNKNIQIFRQFALNLIEKKVKQLENADKSYLQQNQYEGIIDYLLKQNKLKRQCLESDRDKKDFYTFQQLVDEFASFFTAGSDAVYNSTTAMIYLIATHPEVERKIRQELKEVLENDEGKINQSSLKKMIYLQNVHKETLRMHTTITGIMLREAKKDHYLGGIPISKGTYIYLTSKSNHFKEENFDQPLEFRPERWENVDLAKMKPYSYFPFSAGLRACPGQHLSLIEVRIAVAIIMIRYKQINMEKKDFKFIQKISFGPEDLITTFVKAD